MIIYAIQTNGGNENSPDFLNVMVNYHYHGENRVITRLFPSMVIGWIIFSLNCLFLPGMCIAIPYGYNGYYLCTYACMCVCVHSATRTQVADSFEGVIHIDSFEGVFRMDNVEGVHVCACMCTMHGYLLTGMINY